MNLNRRVWMAAFAGLMTFGTISLTAQDGGGAPPRRGNFDPEQMRQRMMERYREQLEVKDDAEWKLISERIEKVSEAQRDLRSGMGNAFGRGGRRPGGDAPPTPGGGAGGGGGDQAGRDRARAFMGEPSPESEALQQAIDSKAAAEELKAKLAKVREARKAKQAKLDKAQDDLRQVLSMRQEAIAVVNGLLN